MPLPDIMSSVSGQVGVLRHATAVEITRQGEDWRIAFPCEDVITLPDGSTVTRPAAPVTMMFSQIASDAQAAQAFGVIRDLTIRALTGDLKPVVSNAQ